MLEDDVWSHSSGHKVCLAKSAFAVLCKEHVAVVDFVGFVPLFKELMRLRDHIEDVSSLDERSPTFGFKPK